MANCRKAGQGGAFVWAAQLGDGLAGGVVYQLEVSNTGRHTFTCAGSRGSAPSSPAAA